MELFVRNKIYDFDLMDLDQREKAMQFFKSKNDDKLSFLNSLLTIYSKIKGFEEIDESHLKNILRNKDIQGDNIENIKEKKGEQSICYTYFDVMTNFFHIYMNFEKIEEDDEINPELVSFMLLHQVVHSYFGHFTRQNINNYRERNGKLLDLILDSHVNTFLINALGYKKTINKETQKAYKYIEEKFCTLDKLYEWSNKNFEISNDFDIDNSFESINKILKSFDTVFDQMDIEIPMNMGSFDDNEASTSETISMAAELNLEPARLETLNNNSMDYLEDTAREAGLGMSEQLRGQKEVELVKKSILEVLKLRTVLKQSSKTSYKKTWRRVHKKREYDDGICMKGKVPAGGKKHIVVAVDVSGSVSEDEIKLFKSHIGTFQKKNKDKVVIDYVCWSSGPIEPEIDVVQDLDVKKLKEHQTRSYGGNDFEYVSTFINEFYKDKKEITFINITDGYYGRARTRLGPHVKTHYGILTMKNMESEYKRIHADENVKEVHEIRNDVITY